MEKSKEIMGPMLTNAREYLATRATQEGFNDDDIRRMMRALHSGIDDVEPEKYLTLVDKLIESEVRRKNSEKGIDR